MLSALHTQRLFGLVNGIEYHQDEDGWIAASTTWDWAVYAPTQEAALHDLMCLVWTLNLEYALNCVGVTP